MPTFYDPTDGYVSSIHAETGKIVGYVFGQTQAEAEGRAAVCAYALKHMQKA